MLTAPKLVGRDTEVQSRRLESLRTTDEAPVRRIRQLLPDGPVTGLDIGCETDGTRGCCVGCRTASGGVFLLPLVNVFVNEAGAMTLRPEAA